MLARTKQLILKEVYKVQVYIKVASVSLLIYLIRAFLFKSQTKIFEMLILANEYKCFE